jgi:hypothetical protein
LAYCVVDVDIEIGGQIDWDVLLASEAVIRVVEEMA